jgi:hypothetical protein
MGEMRISEGEDQLTSANQKIERPRLKRIVILGMGRSGTSFLTGCLAKCGVYVDEVSDKFEHTQSKLINDTILREHYGARHGLPYGKLPAGEIQLQKVWHDKAREFVDYMETRAHEAGATRYWTFKDPRTTVLHSLWISHFDVIVGIFRSPEQVVESFLARKWITGWQRKRMALEYWIRFNLSLLEAWKRWRAEKAFFLMDYNADISTQLKHLCERLELPLSEDALGYYDQERNHFSGASRLKDSRALQVYESLRELRNLI